VAGSSACCMAPLGFSSREILRAVTDISIYLVYDSYAAALL